MHDIKIVKSNHLIREHHPNLTLNEQKLLLFLIAQINNKLDTEFHLNTFKLKHYMDLYKITDAGKNYALIKEQIKTLAQKLEWKTTENHKDKSVLMGWVNYVEIDAHTKEIKMKLHESLKPYLLQQKDNFTSYDLSNIIPMKSRYSIRLYEVLKSYAYQKQVCLSIDQIKTMLSATRYKRFSLLNQWVLTIALDEINRYTDLDISYTTKKDGRKYTHLIFDIKTKGVRKEKAVDKPYSGDQSIIDVEDTEKHVEAVQDKPMINDLKEQKEPKNAIKAPPTKDEIRRHVEETHIVGVDLDIFMGYYQASGWKNTKGYTVNWKQCLVVWAHNSKQKQQEKAISVPLHTSSHMNTSYDADEWERENLYKTPKL